jgi:hypothetical protein
MLRGSGEVRRNGQRGKGLSSPMKPTPPVTNMFLPVRDMTTIKTQSARRLLQALLKPRGDDERKPLLLKMAVSLLLISLSSVELISIWPTMKESHLSLRLLRKVIL